MASVERSGQERRLRLVPDVPTRHGEPWNDEDEALFQLLMARGENIGHMAHRLGRTVRAVQAHIRGPEVTGGPSNAGRPWSDEERVFLVRLRHEQNLWWREIAELMGRTPIAVEVEYVRIIEGQEEASKRFAELQKRAGVSSPRTYTTKVFRAKFANTCPACRQRFGTGDRVQYNAQHKVIHASCDPDYNC